MSCLVGWLVGCLAGWLAGWLNWLIAWATTPPEVFGPFRRASFALPPATPRPVALATRLLAEALPLSQGMEDVKAKSFGPGLGGFFWFLFHQSSGDLRNLPFTRHFFWGGFPPRFPSGRVPFDRFFFRLGGFPY